MIVLATELASTKPYRFGPLDTKAAESLVIQLAVSGVYARIQLVQSNDIDAEADDRLIAA